MVRKKQCQMAKATNWSTIITSPKTLLGSLPSITTGACTILMNIVNLHLKNHSTRGSAMCSLENNLQNKNNPLPSGTLLSNYSLGVSFICSNLRLTHWLRGVRKSQNSNCPSHIKFCFFSSIGEPYGSSP